MIIIVIKYERRKNMTALPITGGGYITNSILNNLINFLAPVVGIALVVFVCFQGFQIFKGSESASIKKLVLGVGLLLFILGIMYAAGSFESYGNLFKGVTDSIIQKGGKDAGSIVG